MWGKRCRQAQMTKRETMDIEWVEDAIKNGTARLLEELNLRLICEFCGTPCIETEEWKKLLRFAETSGNYPLWRELSLPGNILQVESIDVVRIDRPAAEAPGKKKPGKLKKVLAALFWLLRGKKKDAMS